MYAKCIKRCLDFIISLVALVLLSPLLLIVTIINAIKMKGNPFFAQIRPGKRPIKGKNSDGSRIYGDEKLFKLVKFRSMTNERDKKTGELLPDEQRLTKWGLLLRKTSIDELPELWNILKGDMAIVGPRPLLTAYVPYYTETERQRHLCRGGLTGLAQVRGRNSITWDEKLAYDVEYVNNISFVEDIRIISDTVKMVLFKSDNVILGNEGNFAEIRAAEQKSREKEQGDGKE